MSSGSAKKNTAIAKATAKLQIRIAKEMHEVWTSYYKRIEIKAVDEYIAEVVPEIDYEENQGRLMTSVKSRFKDAFIALERCYAPFSTGYNQVMLSNLTKAQTRAIGDSVMTAYRLARFRHEALKDLHHNKGMELIGLGRGVIRQASSYAATAGAGASSMARQADQSTGNTLKAVGYLMERDWSNANVPKYNARHTGQNPTMRDDLNQQGRIDRGGRVPESGRAASRQAPDSNFNYNVPNDTNIPTSNASSDISLIDSLSNLFKG